MNKTRYRLPILIVALLLIISTASGSSVEIYYGPQGGFCPANNSRTLEFSDGSIRPATLANALLHRIDRLEAGSTVKMAMYSMSDYRSLDAMIDAAANKNIKFKLLLDGSAPWSASNRNRIIEKVKKARSQALENDMAFDFQIALVTAEAMKRNKRTSELKDGTLIWGTMHEKFGIFYKPGNPVPHSAFNGSANISPNSSEDYAENRVFFDDQPVVARQLQEQFARLWNEYSTGVVGPCIPERHIVADHVPGYTRLIFNAEPVDELTLTRIDSELLNMIGRVEPEGSLDLAMFSLTRPDLVDQLLRIAELRPDARFRLLLDHSQLDDSNPDAMRQAPSLEARARELGLENIEVRYRFRHNAYSYNKRENKPELLSYLNLFWHHKTLTVNDKEMALGSYNWSYSAEFLNFENMMLFNAAFKDHDKVIASFKCEFDTMWNSTIPAEAPTKPRRGMPQTVTLTEGKALHNKLLKILEKPENHQVLQTMDREAFKTFAQIKEDTGLSRSKANKALKVLRKNGLVVKWKKDGVEGYSQAD